MNINDIKNILESYEGDDLDSMLQSFCIVQAVNVSGNLFVNVDDNKAKLNEILRVLRVAVRVKISN